MKVFKRKSLFSLVLVLFVLALTACVTTQKATLKANVSEVSVNIGEVIELDLTATKDAKYTAAQILSNLEYASSDQEVVKVEEGILTAVGAGECEITASWSVDKTVKTTVKVIVLKPELGTVTYSKLPEYIYVGDVFTIDHTGGDDVTVTYVSSDEEVVKVNGNSFEALQKGTATITATATNGYDEEETKWDVEVIQGEYTITYVLNGGKNSSNNPAKYDVRNLPLVLEPATKTNKKFLGWTYEAESSDYITEIPAGATGDVTLYAHFEDIIHNISYELDGGVLATDAPLTYVQGSTTTLPKPEKEGYIFLGWKLSLSDETYVTKIAANKKTDLTVYAVWEKEPVYSNIIYILNEAILPAGDYSKYLEGTEYVLPIPKKEGYDFLGWSLNEASTTYITSIASTSVGEVTVYANFAEKVDVYSNIVYILNDGVLPEGDYSKYLEGEEFVLPVPTKDGYKFLGWSLNEASTTYITVIASTSVGEVTVYANFEEKIVIEGAVYVGAGLDYETLDDAVSSAEDGAIIVLEAGEYELSVKIAKSFTILGPNANLAADEARGEEALIHVAKDVAGNLAAKNIVFNGVHLKGTGGGGGIPGVFFQDGGSVEVVKFLSCVISDMNTLVKFVGGSSNLELSIENSYIHTIGQFIVWTTTSLSKLNLVGNIIDGSTCGAVTNENAALFRIRYGYLEAYDNLFIGDSLNAPGYFELSAAGATSVVKFNTFKNVSKYVFTSKDNNAVFDQNLYLDANNQALTTVPATLKTNGLTTDTTLCVDEADRAGRYVKELISLYPERYFEINYELNGAEFVSGAPVAYDSQKGIATLPQVENGDLIFLGWYLNGEKVQAVPAGTTGNITLVARWREDALVVDGTSDEGHYETLQAALAAVKPGETIKLVAGEYTTDVTINVANIRIIGPNVGVNPNTNTRNAEAIVKGVFNVTSAAQGLVVDGLAFTGNAKVVYAESVNYDGFVFQNNKVYDTTDATQAWDESRYTLKAFLQFTMASSSKLTNMSIFNNSFVNVSEINLLANRVVNLSVDGNLFKDFDLDAIRVEGGNCYGDLAFTNNVFEQTTALNASNGIFLYSIGGANSSQPTHVVIKNNSFIKLGKDNGSVFTGAVSAYRFQENYTVIEIENNIFDHCYDYLYLRNNGGNASTWNCNVENNQFLGLPTNQYYGSYRGSDSESSNPHLCVFTKNYYEDNNGAVITDLSAYASYFKHMSSYGEALATKPEEVEVETVEFFEISYDLNGGSTKEAFVYNYSSLISEAIVLPVLTLTNHQFNGWLLDGVLVSEIPTTARGNLHLVADFSVLEGEMYNIEFVTNKENVIWPSRPAVDRNEIIDALFADLYEWAQTNGETKSYSDYVADIKTKIDAYSDIKLRNTSLGNYPAEDGSTEYFLNVPKYYQKWNEFFAVFHQAMLAVNPDQSFYTDTYATMVRLSQFVNWSATGEKYFASSLTKLCNATKIPQEIPTNYRGGQILNLPAISLANGLEFLGWYDNPECTGSPVTKINATDAGDKVYYAKWAAEIQVESIEVNKINELLLFKTHQLVWTLTPANATDLSVEFFSSNEGVATVSAKGLITALANGTTTITIRVYGNRALDVKFDLLVFTNDYIDGSYETESYVLVDESIKLNAIVNHKDGTQSAVKWTSLTPEIATVDENGLVTAINSGVAKIVAVDPTNEELKLEFVVMVYEELPEGILKFALEANESNVFTRYDLNIGNTYNKDILGSVSQVLANSPLVKDKKFYDKANESAATYGVMESIEFITVHYTGNMASGADAAANASYFATNGSTSIHYTTGNDGVFYCMDESKGAWHAGDSGALDVVGKFEWIPSGVKVAAGDPMYPNFTISNDFYYEINGKKTTIKMPSPWNYSSRGTDHTLNADGTISSNANYKSTAFSNRTPESFINDQSLPFMIVGDEYYMGTTWWAYTQVYEGRICSTGGNRNSIGIESCVNEGSDLWFTWQRTAQLVADLMVRHNLDITRVRGHHFYTAKDCPQPMLENDQEIWYEFLELVETEYELLTKYQGYEVSIVSNNPDIVDNHGRVIKQPDSTTCVTYTITFTKDGESKSITLASMVDGLYTNR